MSDSHRMSRRDWFRLRPRAPESTGQTRPAAGETAHAMGESSSGLQPIAYPENHDGMNLSDLPPMREAQLSASQVRQLFTDIEALASDILLMQRATRSPRATASIATPSGTTTPEQLRTAQETLLSGAVPRVQIRYHWQAANWIDTLEARDGGVRLVRIAHNLPDTA